MSTRPVSVPPMKLSGLEPFSVGAGSLFVNRFGGNVLHAGRAA